ncbi:hypothetical protein [Pseudomonas sp. CMR5c]|uniref:hypothetical protein n=1 Tax=Pseudomonas sp. CMR5c TaxID=658630 RepID=UPI000F56858F|nr:hypothetical protein [Pseudomonas sp. CMR5c]
MSEVFVVKYTAPVSDALRAGRKLAIRLSDPKPLEVGFVIVVDGGIPIWIGKIDSFNVSTGKFPKDVEIFLSDLVLLEDAWSDVSPLVHSADLRSARFADLDVNHLFGLGARLTEKGDTPGVLTATNAISRLAWTYGVPRENVKVSIEF